MGRAPCCSKVGLHRGPWTAKEDRLLINYIRTNGEGHWRSLPKKAGLLRCGKSCRLRWMNYLRPGIKRGNITPDEDDLIIRLHSLLGNQWSLIAGRLPGRTDNEIKNYWNSHLSKRFMNKRTTKKAADHDPPRKITPRNKIPKGGSEGGCSRGSSTQDQESQYIGKTSKIHQPKTVRVSSVVSTEARNFLRINGDDYYYFPWSNWVEEFDNYDQEIEIKEDDENGVFCGFLSSSSSICQSFIPTKDDDIMMLDEIFDEYDQFLKTHDNNGTLNSFVDSLLA